ncbi:MAG: M23 family metallopeptidase [Nitrospinaceae bacterium]|nr:M23 family metallopeptidase [Nitrospina sp.]MBT5867899.1 M23 family metallopeptidase [Nitrospinaceae bacterium]MBT6345478.1 M23 family metallopeptidase [Nitrospina sp.]
MGKDEFTIVIFPGSLSTPKKIRLPKRFVKISVLVSFVVLIGVLGSSFYFTQQFLRLQGSETELVKLRRESKIRKIQVEKFAQQVKNFETEMSRLERFEKKLRVITALENSPKSIEKNWGVGGPYGLSSNSFTTAMGRGASTMVDRLSNGLDHLSKQAKIESISFQELDNFFKNQKSLLSSTPSIWPTRGWVTSNFGFRKSPFTGLREKHEGWDIAARNGSPVRATADGVVVVEGREYGYGNLVEVDHGYGLVTRYGHNSKHLVKVGDRIKRGQVVSLVGSTGRSTGPHLHYEVLLHGVPVNPKNYILED